MQKEIVIAERNLAKNMFQVHAISAKTKVLIGPQFRRVLMIKE